MSNKQPPKYRAPKSHFSRQAPPTPAPAYTTPIQWMPPSSPVLTPHTLPSFSIPTLDALASLSFPSEEHSSLSLPLLLFRANHPSTPPPARRRWSNPRRHLARPQPYRLRRHLATLLLAAGLLCQLATLAILGTALTWNNSRPFGGTPKQSQLSSGPEDGVTQASSGNSQSTTPEL